MLGIRFLVGSVDWGDLPTWLTGIGTLAAAGVALWLAGREGRRMRAEQQRHQAELITAWLDSRFQVDPERPPMDRSITVRNASTQLVYEVIVSLIGTEGSYRRDAKEGGEEYRALVGQVPPGDFETVMHDVDYGMSMRFGVEIAFQDAAGRCWRRHGDGRLEELRVDPVDFYGIGRPVSWESG